MSITIQAGKRYYTRSGWITPPLQALTHDVFKFGIAPNFVVLHAWKSDGTAPYNEIHNDIISEYVEPFNDTFRRDLIARLYVAMVGGGFTLENLKSYDALGMAKLAIDNADTLIEAMETQQ